MAHVIYMYDNETDQAEPQVEKKKNDVDLTIYELVDNDTIKCNACRKTICKSYHKIHKKQQKHIQNALDYDIYLQFKARFEK